MPRVRLARTKLPNTAVHGSGLKLTWPASVAAAAQHRAATLASGGEEVLHATVSGHTTPNLQDIGGASVRLKLPRTLEEGGYLLALRPAPGLAWLPAIAGVPGERGPDDHGPHPLSSSTLLDIRPRDQPAASAPWSLVCLAGVIWTRQLLPFQNVRRGGQSTKSRGTAGLFRPGLAECMLLGRPVVPAAEAEVAEPLVTFVDERALAGLYPVGGSAQVLVLAKVTDFFLGCAAATTAAVPADWLHVRLRATIQHRREPWAASLARPPADVFSLAYWTPQAERWAVAPDSCRPDR